MLDDADQRELAKRIRPLLEDEGVEVVFVGSTAIVGLGLFPRTSKDADALGPPGLTTQKARKILENIAEDQDLVVQEKGWGTVALAQVNEEGEEDWSVDLLVPKGGIIPEEAASRIHHKAEETDIGPTAIPAHILAMKAVAYGDCMRKGERGRADDYENDLLQLDRTLPEDIDWEEVKQLLSGFPSTRARDAADKLHEIFGVDLGYDRGPDPSIA